MRIFTLSSVTQLLVQEFQAGEKTKEFLNSRHFKEIAWPDRSTVVMYGCESWTIKKAEHERIDAFELWC